jgi:3-deoxy-D-manno-octulosonic-acid transferase
MKINPENYMTDENKINKYEKILNPNILNVVLGSSHEGEEEFVMDALQALNVNLILAPRHPERVKKVLELSESRGLRPIKVSEIGNYGQKELNDNNTIVVFDEVGDLINLYAVADLAIVAGSIIFNKGHNFMEPIFANTLCITGAKLNNYKQLKRDLCDTNKIETFETKNQLRALVDKYKDSNIRDKKLISQKKALEELSGSYELIIDILNDI